MEYTFDQETYLETGEKVKIKTVIAKGKDVTYRLYDGRIFTKNDFFPAPEPKKRKVKKYQPPVIDFPEEKESLTDNQTEPED